MDTVSINWLRHTCTLRQSCLKMAEKVMIIRCTKYKNTFQKRILVSRYYCKVFLCVFSHFSSNVAGSVFSQKERSLVVLPKNGRKSDDNSMYKNTFQWIILPLIDCEVFVVLCASGHSSSIVTEVSLKSERDFFVVLPRMAKK